MSANDNGRPEARLLDAFVANNVGVTTQRLAFTQVDARRTNGHVQGIAAYFPDGDTQVMYASVSDFPPGWGACLIERDDFAAMEAMALPQGFHAGGVNICDGLLCVPVEHYGRYGRIYIYSLDDPLYPRLVGYHDQSIFNHRPTSAKRPRWRSAVNGSHAKASAAALAPFGDDQQQRYLVAVLHQHRYLRFITFDYEGDSLMPTGEMHTLDAAEACWDWPYHDGDRGSSVDNISLFNTDDGFRLVVFSAHGLVPGLNVQKKFIGETTDRISVYALDFDHETPRLHRTAQGEMYWLDGNRRRRTEWCWPGFRWGASMSWCGGDKFALFATEFFGDEEATSQFDRKRAPAQNGKFDGHVQYLQFATNLDNAHFGDPRRAGRAELPPVRSRIWSTLRELGPVGSSLVRHYRPGSKPRF